MIAVSTAWNAARHAGWAPAASELLALGHRQVALDGAALHPDGAAARRVVREAGGTVALLFAPRFAAEAPGGAGTLGLADPDDARRAVAVAGALSAAKAAEAAGVSVVVLRVGAVPDTDPGRERRWLDALRTGASRAEVRADAAAQLLGTETARHRYLDALCRALFDLGTAAPDVTWLLETPAGVLGLPFPDDFLSVAEELPRRRIGYWHDVAHATRLAALGVVPAAGWLDALGDRAAGATLSDWTTDDVRLPPGAGIVDWPGLLHQCGRGMVRVLRIDPSFPAPLVQDALDNAQAHGF